MAKGPVRGKIAMTFINLFAPSTAALYSNATAFQVIGDNIANATTPGYKAADTRFVELLTSTPKQVTDVYGGVKPSIQNFIDKQGPIERTDRTFDIALSGRGFLVSNTAVDASGAYQLGRSGQLIATTVYNGGTEESYLTDATGSFILGWQADANGNIATGTDVSSLVPIRVDPEAVIFDPVATTAGSFDAILPAGAATGTVHTTSMPVVDGAGAEHSLTLQFTKSATPYTWDLAVSVSDGTVTGGGSATLTFDVDGTLLSPTAQSIGLTFAGAGGSTSVDLDLTAMRGYAGEFIPQDYSQNGIPVGELLSYSIDKNGVLSGNFSNGRTRALYQIAVGTVPSPDLMKPIDGTHFALTDKSGDLSLVDASTTDMVSFVSGALEQSTTELATEFNKMILAQQSYSTATRAYTVADEMARVATELKS
jgi:flagellar hook protein FlgE